jgi:hypothetical protein
MQPRGGPHTPTLYEQRHGDPGAGFGRGCREKERAGRLCRVVSGFRSSVLAAELELATTAVIADEGLRYTVVNIGVLPIILGEAYELERWTDGRWERVKVSTNFRLWGRRLESGDRFELTSRIPEFVHRGRYRLRKRLAVDRDPHPGYEWVARQEIEPLKVTAEFEVTKD